MLAGMIMRPRAISARINSGGYILPARHILHLAGDLALPRVMHLRADFVAGALSDPIGANHKSSDGQAWAAANGCANACATRSLLHLLFRLLGLLAATIH